VAAAPVAPLWQDRTMARLLGPLTGRATYRRWLYLLGGGALAFSFLVVTLPLGQLAAGVIGWPPLAVLAVVVVALAPPLAAGCIPGVRQVEAAAVRALLGTEVPDPPADPARPWPARWRTAAWFLLHLAAGGLVGLVTVVVPPAAVVLAAAPFRPVTTMELGTWAWDLPRGPGAAWLVPLALALLVALVLVAAGLGALLARWAPAFLGPSPAERLALLERQAGQLAERNRLARELHDSVGHALTVATLQAGAARRLLDTDPAFARDALASVEDASRAALDDLDHVLGLLRDGDAGATAPQPTLADLDRLLAETRAAGVEVRAEPAGDLARVPAVVSREAYRIVQEGLTNALRHAGRVPVTLRLAAGAERLELELTNSLGPATRHPPAGGGRGLRGIGERVAILGGRMTAGADGTSWRVAVSLPLRPGGEP
jgi:signal transduction histidine kinase